MRALDLFAGCGGWDVACAALGIAVDGVEVMPEARATRDAAGMSTTHDDVWTVPPSLLRPGTYDGLIASPPCQTFSMAGKGSGRAALDAVLGLVAGRSWEDLNGLRGAVDSHGWDERTGLVLVPLAYWHAMRPQWVALEQVPAVLPVWEAMATVMREAGYSVWTGYLTSEMYGVPQTRKRAVLMAKRCDCGHNDSILLHDRCKVAPPEPTHSRYYPRDKTRLDPGVRKWVSMAEALGFGLGARPSPVVMGAGSRADGSSSGGGQPIAHYVERWMSDESWVVSTGNNSFDLGPGQRGEPGERDWRAMSHAYERPVADPSPTLDAKVGGAWKLHPPGERPFVMRSNYGTGGDPAARGERASDEPAPTVTSKVDRNKVIVTNNVSAPGNSRDRGADNYGPYTRPVEEPSPTVSSETGRWYVGDDDGLTPAERRKAPPVNSPEQREREQAGRVEYVNGTHAKAARRATEEPAPSIMFGARLNTVEWQEPDAKSSVRVSVDEAALLQSFPPGFPFAGTRTKQYLQVGNAIPPLLALAILKELV